MVEVNRELHVERLLGCRVRDVNGEVVGRIEEIVAENVDGDMVVTELHFGSAAMVERIMGFVHELPFFRLLPYSGRVCRARWSDMDFSDPHRPRVLRSRTDLDRVEL